MRAGHLKVLAGLGISAGALYLLLSGLSRGALLEAWSHLSGAGVLAALALLVIGYSLRVVRWWWMLRSFEPNVRVSDCVTPFVASIALNNVLPLRAGDALRAFGFHRQLRLPASTVLGTVVVERLLDLLALLVCFFAGLAFAPDGALPDSITTGAALLAAGAAAVLIALPLAGPSVAAWLRPVDGAGRADSPSLMARLRSGLAGLLDSFALLRSLRRAALLVPLTLAIWLFEGAVFAAVAANLAGGTAAPAAWFAMACGTLATLLPSTPGYVGTFDYFAMLGLTVFGASREVATAFSLTVHAVLWAPVTLVGLSLLALHGGMSALRPGRQQPAGRTAP
jgi:uncharacterized membrane protein YbhN (UPF0104 family)